MEDAGTRELVVVLGITAVLFLLGLVAVALFVRQWRREKKGGGSDRPDAD